MTTDGAARTHEQACVLAATTATATWSYYAHAWMRSPRAFTRALTQTQTLVRLQS
jgi:hypothetical protein